MNKKYIYSVLGLTTILVTPAFASVEVKTGIEGGYKQQRTEITRTPKGYANYAKNTYKSKMPYLKANVGLLLDNDLSIDYSFTYGWRNKGAKGINKTKDLGGSTYISDTNDLSLKGKQRSLEHRALVGYIFDLGNGLRIKPHAGIKFNHTNFGKDHNSFKHKHHSYAPLIGIEANMDLNGTWNLVGDFNVFFEKGTFKRRADEKNRLRSYGFEAGLKTLCKLTEQATVDIGADFVYNQGKHKQKGTSSWDVGTIQQLKTKAKLKHHTINLNAGISYRF